MTDCANLVFSKLDVTTEIWISQGRVQLEKERVVGPVESRRSGILSSERLDASWASPAIIRNTSSNV